jgi:hypothetical protein
MDKVSWRRILQRAGNEFPSETGAAIIQMRPGSQTLESGWRSQSGEQSPPPHEPETGGLETELKRVLDRAARRDHGSRASGTPSGWEPIFMARDAGAMAREKSLRAPDLRSKAPPPPALRPQAEEGRAKRASSGGRNILAISISVAVVGLAFQQISTQWNQSRIGGNGVRAVPEATTRPASALYAGAPADNARSASGARTDGREAQSLQLRPTLTDNGPSGNGDSGKDQDAFNKEIEQAASMLDAAAPPREAARRAAVTQVWAPSNEPVTKDLDAAGITRPEEESMLRRARELMARGHISGARLIFEHLALQQSALGAFALAQTYDEKFLATLRVKGMQPDPKLAEKWYRRAAELVSRTAEKN